jgi:hypothetical protein
MPDNNQNQSNVIITTGDNKIYVVDSLDKAIETIYKDSDEKEKMKTQ